MSKESIENLHAIETRYSIEPTKILDFITEHGLDSYARFIKWDEVMRNAGSNKESFPPYPLSKKEIIFYNNTITKSNPIVAAKILEYASLPGEDKKSPLEKKAEAKKRKKKKPNLPPPVDWVDLADNGKIPLELYNWAEEKGGFDYHKSVEMFESFINYHLKKGSVFADWTRAWYTWVKNQIKFGGGLRQDSVVRSFKTFNPMKDMFNE